MAYTKQNFVDGQVLTAEQMNKIDEALSDPNKIYTSNEYLGSNDPCNIRMWKLNPNSQIVEGLCVVTPGSI